MRPISCPSCAETLSGAGRPCDHAEVVVDPGAGPEVPLAVDTGLIHEVLGLGVRIQGDGLAPNSGAVFRSLVVGELLAGVCFLILYGLRKN